MGKKEKGKPVLEAPLDLTARIGGRAAGAEQPAPPAAPVAQSHPPRLDGPLPPRRTDARPMVIGMDEPAMSLPPVPAADEDDAPRSTAIPSPRTPPGPGETDIVATPLPTPDDWHRFELALRRVRGVGQVRTEYYRHGVLKVRVGYTGAERLAHALRDGMPGYHVRVIGEDRSTIQILVSSGSNERRPG